MSKKAKVILGISLALNLLFIGLAGGAAWKFKKFKHDGNRIAFFVQKLIRDLPEERQKVLLADFKDLNKRPDQLEAKRKHWKAVIDAVSAEPFNAEAVRQAMTVLHKSRHDRKLMMGEKIIAMLEKMTPEERKTMREGRMFQRLKNGGRHRWGRGH